MPCSLLYFFQILLLSLSKSLFLSNYMSHMGTCERCRRGQGVANFVNLVHFGPSTFHLSSWSFTVNLDNLLGFIHVYPLVFWIFFIYFFFFSYFFLMKSKIDNNKCPLFTMFTKQNFFKSFAFKLVKKKCLSNLLGDPPIQKLCF